MPPLKHICRHLQAHDHAFELSAMENSAVQVAETDSGARIVIFVAPDSPAERYGVRVGDQLVRINREDAGALSRE